MAPVVFNVFVSIPLNGTTTTYLQQILPQIAAANAICLLSVEPDQGLSAVTTSAVQELASYIMEYEQVGVLSCSSVLLGGTHVSDAVLLRAGWSQLHGSVCPGDEWQLVRVGPAAD